MDVSARESDDSSDKRCCICHSVPWGACRRVFSKGMEEYYPILKEKLNKDDLADLKDSFLCSWCVKAMAFTIRARQVKSGEQTRRRKSKFQSTKSKEDEKKSEKDQCQTMSQAESPPETTESEKPATPSPPVKTEVEPLFEISDAVSLQASSKAETTDHTACKVESEKLTILPSPVKTDVESSLKTLNAGPIRVESTSKDEAGTSTVSKITESDKLPTLPCTVKSEDIQSYETVDKVSFHAESTNRNDTTNSTTSGDAESKKQSEPPSPVQTAATSKTVPLQVNATVLAPSIQTILSEIPLELLMPTKPGQRVLLPAPYTSPPPARPKVWPPYGRRNRQCPLPNRPPLPLAKQNSGNPAMNAPVVLLQNSQSNGQTITSVCLPQVFQVAKSNGNNNTMVLNMPGSSVKQTPATPENQIPKVLPPSYKTGRGPRSILSPMKAIQRTASSDHRIETQTKQKGPERVTLTKTQELSRPTPTTVQRYEKSPNQRMDTHVKTAWAQNVLDKPEREKQSPTSSCPTSATDTTTQNPTTPNLTTQSSGALNNDYKWYKWHERSQPQPIKPRPDRGILLKNIIGEVQQRHRYPFALCGNHKKVTGDRDGRNTSSDADKEDVSDREDGANDDVLCVGVSNPVEATHAVEELLVAQGLADPPETSEIPPLQSNETPAQCSTVSVDRMHCVQPDDLARSILREAKCSVTVAQMLRFKRNQNETITPPRLTLNQRSEPPESVPPKRTRTESEDSEDNGQLVDFMDELMSFAEEEEIQVGLDNPLPHSVICLDDDSNDSTQSPSTSASHADITVSLLDDFSSASFDVF